MNEQRLIYNHFDTILQYFLTRFLFTNFDFNRFIHFILQMTK